MNYVSSESSNLVVITLDFDYYWRKMNEYPTDPSAGESSNGLCAIGPRINLRMMAENGTALVQCEYVHDREMALQVEIAFKLTMILGEGRRKNWFSTRNHGCSPQVEAADPTAELSADGNDTHLAAMGDDRMKQG